MQKFIPVLEKLSGVVLEINDQDLCVMYKRVYNYTYTTLEPEYSKICVVNRGNPSMGIRRMKEIEEQFESMYLALEEELSFKAMCI